MVHLDRIYTRSGDKGTTGLGDGRRVSKLDPRIVAGGSVDETNCAIGVAISAQPPREFLAILSTLQQFLFDLGADLCIPKPVQGEDVFPGRMSQTHVDKLERLIDQFTDSLEPLGSFILPGGHPAAAALHLARAVCRRAELDTQRLHEEEPINPLMLVCLNRLSDLLFVLARAVNDNGQSDVLWKPGVSL